MDQAIKISPCINIQYFTDIIDDRLKKEEKIKKNIKIIKK